MNAVDMPSALVRLAIDVERLTRKLEEIHSQGRMQQIIYAERRALVLEKRQLRNDIRKARQVMGRTRRPNVAALRQSLLDFLASQRETLMREIMSMPRADSASACGVYFLLEGEEIVYVGQSVNIESRVAHHRRFLRFDSYASIAVPDVQLDDVEQSLIRVLRPRLNRNLYTQMAANT